LKNTKPDRMTYKVRKQSALVTAAVVREKLYNIYLQSVRQRVLHPKRYQHQRALMKQEKASTRELFWIKREVSTSGKGLEVIRNSVLVTYDSCTIEEKVYVPNIAATAAQNAAAKSKGECS